MATAICLDCRESVIRADVFIDWSTSNALNHHIVIIAKNNAIEGIKAKW